MTLRRKIEQEIAAHGPIPFSRYMGLCLYDSEFGYYSRNAEQFGKAGDFYTSSDVHAVFGRLMARQFEEMWRILGNPKRLKFWNWALVAAFLRKTYWIGRLRSSLNSSTRFITL